MGGKGAAALVLTLWAGAVRAHASEQGFVLLLPTDIYIGAGVLSVALTLLLLAVLPEGLSHALFRPLGLWPRPRPRVGHVTSLATAAVLVWLVLTGLSGSRDPLVNPLPLTIWVVWWITLVSVQGLFGNVWRWLDPWVGPAALMAAMTGERAPLRYPRRLGHLPALAGFLAFGAFLLADPAPADPARLAWVVGAYWLANLGALMLFGPAWLVRAEFVTVLMRAYGRMALFGRTRGRVAVGLPGWQVLRAARPVPLGLALFILLLLGAGSFDGLNETFWWLGMIDVNPLEFPGRSAVMRSTLAGLLVSNLGLVAVFAVTLWLGLRIAGGGVPLGRALRVFAPSILPIALAYHIAHYLTSFLVDGQYVLSLVSRALGGEGLRVTAGFLNTPGPVKMIWLTQAGVVVAGHVIAILIAHALALGLLGGTRRAVLSQLPLALFMVGYTFFGLWLLASPRGM
ncbi:hypothetical protein K1T73_02185 [Roseovarius sp. SCSIO 43702]|uniref:hypothetical protein n=1 Tax=Roseovarius sp. SCSIO 43702 TaxID=2823043 RepID=UPI001C730311|nr:hypothetical protein [Roseovarius sp. SCSIO 43702]QYX57240.1 hypothetical protein K1T73_02185 [Roseovarius sp. SCSIO 43702]